MSASHIGRYEWASLTSPSHAYGLWADVAPYECRAKLVVTRTTGDYLRTELRERNAKCVSWIPYLDEGVVQHIQYTTLSEQCEQRL